MGDGGDPEERPSETVPELVIGEIGGGSVDTEGVIGGPC